MQKRKIPLFRKIIDGSRGVAPIQSESTIDTKTSIDFDRPPALTFASAFLLIYPRGATFLCLRGLSDSNGRERKKKKKSEREAGGKKSGGKKEKRGDPCGIARVEYVERITRSSRTESPDQLHNGATETDALQPPPRAPLAPSHTRSVPALLAHQPLSQSDYRTKG